MRPFWKEFLKEMVKPVDGKKTNWIINGIVALIFTMIFIGIILYG
jgi:hypothetical protein